MRPCSEVKKIRSQKCYTNMYLILLRLNGVVDMKLTKET